MNLGCFDKLGLFTSKVTVDDNKAEIVASAYSLEKKKSRAAFCKPNIATETIVIDGYFSKSNINVTWMESQSSALKVGDTGIYPISTGYIVDAKEICPQIPGGMSCQAVGLNATLNLTLNGCVDKLGNVANKVKLLGNGKAELTVSALGIANEVSTRARCAAMPTENANIFIAERLS